MGSFSFLMLIPQCRFKEMDPSISGRGAEPVYRDRIKG